MHHAFSRCEALRAATQPIDCKAEFATEIPSAPSAIALMKSSGMRKPPVMIKVISLRPN
ncbi:MAG: hypothetical protein Q9M28_11040 [Mariprofundaceae bacterium]|nr:hypothetical protein [Mariprofundaceae bacterium]